MTPQQRLQEAKDQAAREYSNLADAIIADRAMELMYEAGKKEGAEYYLEDLKRVGNDLMAAVGKAETYRKILENILNNFDLPVDGEDRTVEVSIMRKKIMEALKDEPKR